MLADEAALTQLCDTVFVGPMQPYRGSIAFADHAETVAAADLAERDVFDELLARFRSAIPGGDRRAAISFWSQYYFAGLLIPLTVLFLQAGRALPLDLGRVHLSFCPERGTLVRIHLAGRSAERPGDLLVKALIDEQVAPMVAILRRHSGLSAKLLWENAGCYLTWILGEIARATPAPENLAEDLLRDPEWPRVAGSPIGHLKAAVLDSRPSNRRICCLRYCLPGIARCAGTCPLPPVPDPSA